MNSLTLTARDSATMLRRNLRRQLRYPGLTVTMIATPVIILLLFVSVFGGAMGAGLPGAVADGGGRGAYLDFVVPGVLLLGIATAAQGVAISVATDVTTGIVARFRTMSIARVSVLTGHVVGSLLQMLVAAVALVAVALALGFGPTANLLEWLAAAGVVAMVSFAVIWLAVGMGLSSPTVEGASNLPMPLMLLPFLGSGFVPTETLPTGLRWFAEHQPFTPISDLLRGLLFDAPLGDSAVVSTAWCVGLALLGYLWSRRLYDREPRV